MERKVKYILRIIVTVGLLSYIIFTADLSKIFDVLSGINIMFFLVAIGIGIFNVILSAKKWQILLEVKGERQRFRDVLKLYYTGIFFNTFLPTSIGGDVVKAYKMSKISEKPVEAYSSVFMERLTGGIAVLILAIVATTIYFNKLPLEIPLLVFGVFTPLFVFIAFLISRKKFVKRFSRLYSVIFRIFARFALDKKVEKLYDSISLYRKEKKSLLVVMLFSFAFQSIMITNRYILSLSIGMDVPLHFFFVFIPICTLIAFLPISIRGIGVFELMYLYLFPIAGATPSEAISLAFLTHIFGITQSLIGGGVYLTSNVSKKKSDS